MYKCIFSTSFWALEIYTNGNTEIFLHYGDTTFIRPELLGRGINFCGTILLFMAEMMGRLVVIVSKPRFLLAFDMGDFAKISAILARDFCQKAQMQPTKIQFFFKKYRWTITLPKTNTAPKNDGFQYRNFIFQGSIYFHGLWLFVSGRVGHAFYQRIWRGGNWKKLLYSHLPPTFWSF